MNLFIFAATLTLALTVCYAEENKKQELQEKNVCDCLYHGYLNGTFSCSKCKKIPKNYGLARFACEMVTTVEKRCPVFNTFKGQTKQKRSKNLKGI